MYREFKYDSKITLSDGSVVTNTHVDISADVNARYAREKEVEKEPFNKATTQIEKDELQRKVDIARGRKPKEPYKAKKGLFGRLLK